MNKKNNQIYDEDDSIDLIELLSTLWKEKIFIIKSTLIFTLIGVFYSLSLKNNFTASSVFYPHYQSNDISQSQGLKSLAGIAGIDLGNNNSDNIPTTLYPNLISSPEFKIKILDSKINIGENEIIYREYLFSKTSQFNLKKVLLFPITILSEYISKNKLKLSNKNNDILELNEEEYSLHKILSDIITIDVNEKEGFIELSVRDNNPLIASQIAKTANEILQNKIIDFKLKNLNDTYKFISEQLDVAKNNFYKLQDSLAIFSDKNRNIKSDLFLNKYSRIESEYNISKNIYNELALNKEKTAIEVKKNTPIFTIIKPVVIPNEKSDPKRIFIVIAFSFMGLIIMLGYTLLKPIFFETWREIKNNKNK